MKTSFFLFVSAVPDRLFNHRCFACSHRSHDENSLQGSILGLHRISSTVLLGLVEGLFTKPHILPPRPSQPDAINSAKEQKDELEEKDSMHRCNRASLKRLSDYCKLLCLAIHSCWQNTHKFPQISILIRKACVLNRNRHNSPAKRNQRSPLRVLWFRVCYFGFLM